MAVLAGPVYIASGVDVFTYADLVTRMIERRGMSGSNRELVQVQVAIQDAYRELPTLAQWRHYHRRVVIETEDIETFEDAVYVASANTLTTTGTWPANVAFGDILYADKRYKVEERVSNTVIKLSSADRPSENFTQDVRWVRTVYQLPFQLQRVLSVSSEDNMLEIAAVTQDDMVQFKRLMGSAGADPKYYTVRPSSYYASQSEIEIFPIPDGAKRIEVSMVMIPRPLKVYEDTGVNGGTTANSTNFSGTGFTARHQGCVLRISATSALPKPVWQYSEARVATNVEVFVRSYDSATVLVMAEAAAATGSSLGYTLSDYIDIDPTYMLDTLETLAYKKFCKNYIGDYDKIRSASAMFEEALGRAKTSMALAANLMDSPLNSGEDDGLPIGEVYPRGT
jgi:hypothetical protein